MRTITLGDNEYPAHWEICSRCGGDGTHVNRAIDGNGISTSSELWADDDFRDNYMSGMYNVACDECEGRGSVLAIDYDTLTPEQQAEVDEWYQDERDSAYLRQAEGGWSY